MLKQVKREQYSEISLSEITYNKYPASKIFTSIYSQIEIVCHFFKVVKG